MVRPLFPGEVVAFPVVCSHILYPQALSTPPSLATLALFSGMLSATFSSFALKLEYLLWILENDGLKGNYVCTSEKNKIFRCLISKL